MNKKVTDQRVVKQMEKVIKELKKLDELLCFNNEMSRLIDGNVFNEFEQDLSGVIALVKNNTN